MHTNSVLTHSKRKGLPAAVAVASLVALSGCSTSGSTATVTDTGGTPVVGGTLVQRIAADPVCIDPAQQKLRAALGVERQVVDSLMYQAEDGTIEPWLAASYEANADATKYTFHIRSGVTFSDGTPLTAKVVADNIQTLHTMGATAPLVATYLPTFQSATATDDSTVVVSFGTPQAQFLQATTTPSMGIVSESTLALDAGTRCTKGVTGTGPFTVAGYRANDGMDMVRRAGYAWAPKSFANQGEAYLEKMNVVFVPDASVGTGMLLSNQASAEADVSPADWQRVIDGGLMLRTRPMPGFPSAFFLNTKRGPLKDQAVRYALLHGANNSMLIQTASPMTIPSTSVISSTTPGYVNQSDLMKYDVDASTKALDDAGWVKGSDGVRVKDGQRLSLQVNYLTPSSTQWVPYLELAQQGYRDLGIEIKLNPVSSAEDTKLLTAGTYDIRFNGLSRGDPAVLTDVFAGLNPDLDALLTQQSGLANLKDRAPIIEKITKNILQNAYIVPVHDNFQGQAFRSDVKGVIFDNTNTPSFSGAWIAPQ